MRLTENGAIRRTRGRRIRIRAERIPFPSHSLFARHSTRIQKAIPFTRALKSR
jgi:hypothetical protein